MKRNIPPAEGPQDFPTQTGWHWVRWTPEFIEEPVHVVIEGQSASWSYDEGSDYEEVSAKECAHDGTVWFYDPGFIERKKSG